MTDHFCSNPLKFEPIPRTSISEPLVLHILPHSGYKLLVIPLIFASNFRGLLTAVRYSTEFQSLARTCEVITSEMESALQDHYFSKLFKKVPISCDAISGEGAAWDRDLTRGLLVFLLGAVSYYASLIQMDFLWN